MLVDVPGYTIDGDIFTYAVGIGVGVLVAVGVTVGVGVCVAVAVDVGVFVDVGVIVGVGVFVKLGSDVGTAVGVFGTDGVGDVQLCAAAKTVPVELSIEPVTTLPTRLGTATPILRI